MNEKNRPADGWPWEKSPNRPYFFWDPGGDFNYFATEEERNDAAAVAIEGYCDDMWGEGVEQIIAGKLTHAAQQNNRIERPPASEIDDEGYDKDGNRWDPDWNYQCDYKLQPIQQPETTGLKYQAKYICHWPAGSTACCERHAKGLQALARHMCCSAPLTEITEPAECVNCVNEAKAAELEEIQ